MMRIRITVPGISKVEIKVSMPYAPDLLNDMTNRAMVATLNAAAAYQRVTGLEGDVEVTE